MTIDAVPVRLDPGGADPGSGAEGDSVRRIQRQDALGADAWPGFTAPAVHRT
ncbi:hypothetical protein [Arthrobacter sp. B3I4]|uniref:hypothetical protein n=1 Tax=Arthrobacter sp. B3I4 TaxID=3042267 RepID=UPI002784605A|nr:hypothetical protein [Arthrobacter sp. B3I4]MDQ0754592.1 hypothetical protein [Arthrobacter sp. B3I4]